MKYWLMKSEPDAFSIDDLKAAKTEPWDGIRNYQARNMMRDEMKKGDEFIFFKGIRYGRNSVSTIFSFLMGVFATLFLRYRFYEINAQPTIFSEPIGFQLTSVMVASPALKSVTPSSSIKNRIPLIGIITPIPKSLPNELLSELSKL